MRKIIIALLLSCLLTSCLGGNNFNKVAERNRFSEHKIIESEKLKTIEEGILNSEAESRGFDKVRSSAHIIEFEKTGDYAKGKIRILGRYTKEEMLKENIRKSIINYTCLFEYSYKTGIYNWNKIIDENYTSMELDTIEMIEKGILETEAESKGLNLKQSSAHMLEYEKIGDYAKGKVRILGNYTDEQMKKDNIKNSIINYTCSFEYSYTTGYYSWHKEYM